MKRTLSIVLLFARPLHVLNIFFSLLALTTIWRGGFIFLLISILIKMAGYVGAAAYQNFMDAPAYNYFRNTGYQVRWLYLRVFSADLLIYLLTATILLCTHHANVKG